ncbi:MAG: metallophosphoesterase [Akkermansiaceae bacterium]
MPRSFLAGNKKTEIWGCRVVLGKHTQPFVIDTIRLKRISRRSILGALGIGVPSAVWAAAIEPNFLSITKKDITLPRWPKALDGFRIAQLTDIHYRPDTDEKLLEKIKTELKKDPVDLITLTGDFVINKRNILPELFGNLKSLEAKHGIMASPGNHDRWHFNTAIIRKEVQAAGFDYLQNAGTMLSIKGENVYINGLDSIWGGHPATAPAWAGHRGDAPVISLVHEPDPFDDLRANKRIDLQLSGHTHGGQCRVPLIGYAPVKVKYGRNYIYGHYEKDDSHLWVGRGIGTVGPRVRFACAPELAILTLRSSS